MSYRGLRRELAISRGVPTPAEGGRSSHRIADLLLSQFCKSSELQVAKFTEQYHTPLHSSTPPLHSSTPPLQRVDQRWQPFLPSNTRPPTQQRPSNATFERWVRRFHPEVLQKVRASEVVDVELSHDLAEEWLRDFNLENVISVSSLSEAEGIVSAWIREFQQSRQELTQGVQVEEYVFGAGEERIGEERIGEMRIGEARIGEERGSSVEDGIESISRGSVLEAKRIFESLVQRDTSNGEAWFYLGVCHQQRENERQAIAAFTNVLPQDECYASAQLSLAASLQNEYQSLSAIRCLENWLRLCHPNEVSGRSITTTDELKTTLLSLSSPSPDVELCTALGITHCLSQQYETAAQYFRTALESCPQDFMLWNRLGASLANSDRSSESVGAYRRALTLSPGYVRARYNLAIACLNLNSYRESIEHFLICLQQQPQSEAVWQGLRMALTLSKSYNELVNVDQRNLDSDPDLPGLDLPEPRFTGRVNFPRYGKQTIFDPDIPGTPIYRAKPFPPSFPVNRGPTVLPDNYFEIMLTKWLFRNRPNQEILFPDWMILSNLSPQIINQLICRDYCLIAQLFISKNQIQTH
eukprot:sb/3463328/